VDQYPPGDEKHLFFFLLRKICHQKKKKKKKKTPQGATSTHLEECAGLVELNKGDARLFHQRKPKNKPPEIERGVWTKSIKAAQERGTRKIESKMRCPILTASGRTKRNRYSLTAEKKR